MFHGGRNPDGGDITLQESQRTGYPTDVPVKSYDFQAPLSEFGQEREPLRRLKLVNYFLNDFGAQLAPMVARSPANVPSTPADISVARIAARTSGNQGFIFFNNYVRGLAMPSRPGFQVELKLPSGVVRVPSRPINLPSGAYGIWPVNLALPHATLRYSTAQLFKRVQSDGETYYFFFAIPDIPAEFVFDPQAQIVSVTGGLQRTNSADGVSIRAIGNTTDEAEINLASGVHLVLLPRAKAEDIWRGDNPSLLVATHAATFSEGNSWTFESDGDSQISVSVFNGSPPKALTADIQLQSAPGRGFFQPYRASLPAINLKPRVSQIRAASTRGPWQFGPKLSWRPNPIPLAPEDTEFDHASLWRVDVPAIPEQPYLSNVFLTIRYQGDVARLYFGKQLVDDNFWNGQPWTIGLRETIAGWYDEKLSLDLLVMPLPEGCPMYLEDAAALHFGALGLADSLDSVRLVPQYRIQFEISQRR
jgi:hypothetical protein